MAQGGMKIFGIVLVIVGLYEIIAQFAESIQLIQSLSGTWGWVVGLVALVIGGIILYK